MIICYPSIFYLFVCYPLSCPFLVFSSDSFQFAVFNNYYCSALVETVEMKTNICQSAVVFFFKSIEWRLSRKLWNGSTISKSSPYPLTTQIWSSKQPLSKLSNWKVKPEGNVPWNSRWWFQKTKKKVTRPIRHHGRALNCKKYPYIALKFLAFKISLNFWT